VLVDILLGLVVGVIGGFVLGLIGLARGRIDREIVVSCYGAVILVGIAPATEEKRRLSPSRKKKTRCCERTSAAARVFVWQTRLAGCAGVLVGPPKTVRLSGRADTSGVSRLLVRQWCCRVFFLTEAKLLQDEW